MENWKFKWELRPSIEKSNVNTTCIVVPALLVLQSQDELQTESEESNGNIS